MSAESSWQLHMGVGGFCRLKRFKHYHLTPSTAPVAPTALHLDYFEIFFYLTVIAAALRAL